MLLDLPIQDKNAFLSKKQCELCPLKKLKQSDVEDDRILDILYLSAYYPGELCKSKFVQEKQVELIECSFRDEDERTLACCMGRKLALLEKHKPKVVVTTDSKALKELEAALGHSGAKPTSGHVLPAQYKDHKFWIVPVITEGLMGQQLDAKVELEKRKETITEYLDCGPPEVGSVSFAGIEFVTKTEEIDTAFDWLSQQPLVAFDIETNGLRPYKENSKILSVAIGTFDRTFAFPIQHTQTSSKFDFVRVLQRLAELPKSVELIAHNLPFELEWFAQTLGVDFLYSRRFQDTQAQAYLLSRDSKSLDNCIRKHFGFSLKSVSNLDVTKLDSLPLEKVLKYNALDSKYTYLLYETQKQLVEQNQLTKAYDMQIDRASSVVLMQHKGLAVNEEFVHSEIEKLQKALTKTEEKFVNIPEVKQMLEKHGSCNYASNKDLGILFHEYCGVSDQINSFNESFLSAFKHQVSKPILKLRSINKLYSTYVLPFDKSDPQGGDNLFPDGRIHTSYSTMYTRTGRFSSSTPNVQNIPKPHRKVIAADPGHTLIFCDFGQIEWRCGVALTGDPKLIDALWKGLDIHTLWAQRILKRFPKMADQSDPASMKAMRQKAKNSLVFPALFGSSYKSIAEAFKVSVDSFAPILNDFWKEYEAVKTWHKFVDRQAQELGYVLSPFGRRYYMPMSWNDRINYPIQGAASDIVVNAQCKLSRLAIETDRLWLAPVWNCHDELGFSVPDEVLEEAIPIIAKAMLNTKDYQDWLSVPLTIEVSLGPSWGEGEFLDTYSSVDWNDA